MGAREEFPEIKTRNYCHLQMTLCLVTREYVIFQNQRSGMFEQSRDKRNVYYHPWKTCIAPHFSDFDPKKHIVVLESVKGKLLHMHKQFILKEFGVLL